MTTTYSAEAIQQMKDEIRTIIRIWRGILIFLTPQLLILLMRIKPQARLRDRLLITTLLSAYLNLWRYPLIFFLQYHRVALPIWLTFGYPVAFGGILPHACDDTIREIAVWPCVHEDFKTWLINIAGPHGWRYLVFPGQTLLKCAAFFIWTLVGLMLMVKVVRNTPTCATSCEPARTALMEPSDGSERKAKDLEAGDILRESSKNRKQ